MDNSRRGWKILGWDGEKSLEGKSEERIEGFYNISCETGGAVFRK